MLKKGYHFYFCTNVLGLNFFDSAQYDTARSQFFYTKVRISQRNRNRIQKYLGLCILFSFLNEDNGVYYTVPKAESNFFPLKPQQERNSSLLFVPCHERNFSFVS